MEKLTKFFKTIFLLIIIFLIFFNGKTGVDKMKSNAFGKFTDSRDNKEYKTIQIDNKIWMAENLNFAIEKNSWFYNNDKKLGELYGRLYTWDAAKQAVPKGWHLPTEQEIKDLLDYPKALIGGAGKFKTEGTALWNSPNTGATNSTGFSALPGGCKDKDGSFIQLGQMAYFWSGFETGTESALQIGFYADYDRALYTGMYDKNNAVSVRCVKN